MSEASETTFTPINSETRIERLIEKADSAERAMDEALALQYYSQVHEIDPGHYVALRNSALLNSMVGNLLVDDKQKKIYFQRAIELGELCKEKFPERADCHYSYAVGLGRMANISGTRDRVRASKPIKEHAERALELDPDHAGAMHVLGVWNYEVDNLSWLERRAAKLLFGGIPDGSLEEGIASLENAVEKEPGNILYLYDLARVQKDHGNRERAIAALEKALTLEPARASDAMRLELCRNLLSELR